jgi:molybdopterin molybdotransferase
MNRSPATSTPAQLADAGWYEAYRFSHEIADALPSQQVSLDVAVGRILAADVIALCDVPHYASSAMDGWAVAGPAPWLLVDATSLRDGEATSIVTGGLVPAGASSVLRSEHAVLTGDDDRRVLNLPPGGAAPQPADNIRAVGEEATRSDVVIAVGTALNPAHIALAAVCGHDAVTVRRMPRVALILTGDEVVTAGIPSPGFVRDAFGPQLPALVAMLGGTVTSSQRIGDSVDASIAAALADPGGSDVIITTGGTSRSSADHLHPALAELGAELLIDGVGMRPGGPSMLARLPDGRYLVGLPGNPLAAIIGLLSLAAPLLAALGGRDLPALGRATLGHGLSGARGRSRLVPYLTVQGVAEQSQWQGSGMLRGLAEADGILICPPYGAKAGDELDTLPLPWRSPAIPPDWPPGTVPT